jgi:hypothetical protein
MSPAAMGNSISNGPSLTDTARAFLIRLAGRQGALSPSGPHQLISVFGKTGSFIPRTRPGRSRILEYASLGFDVWFIVQGARRDKDLPGIANFPWQGPAALSAKRARKTLRFW